MLAADVMVWLVALMVKSAITPKARVNIAEFGGGQWKNAESASGASRDAVGPPDAGTSRRPIALNITADDKHFFKGLPKARLPE